MLNSRNIILFSILYIFLQSCTLLTSYGRNYKTASNHYNNQRYDLAVIYSIKSLDKKPDYEKSLNLYEKAVPEAIRAHHDNIEEFTTTSGHEDVLVDEYNALFNLIKAIEDANISRTYSLYIKESYEESYNSALQNAAELHHQNGLDLMSLSDKRKYKEAIGEFNHSNSYIENYKNSNALIEECRKKATFSITVMSFENNVDSKYNNMGATVSNKIVSGLSNNSSFTEFVNIVDREQIETVLEELKMSASGLIDEGESKDLGFIKGIDHMITGDVNQIIVNRAKHTSRKENVEHRIQTGEETFLNEDSVEVTVPVYGSEFKEIKIHQLNASSSIEVFLKIIDVSTSNVLKSETFYSKKSYSDEWASGLEDIDPITESMQKLKSKNRSQNNPSAEELLQQAINENNGKILNSIVEFYK